MIQNPVIGIIGGTGLMGQMFKNFFERDGFTVKIAGRKTEFTIEECASTCDVVIVSVPMDKTVDMIKRVGPLVKEEGLLMDFTSLKKDPLDAMLASSKASVIGVHPVFGPGVDSMKEQSVVLCPGRGDEWFSWFRDYVKKSGAILKICKAEEHDKMMAVIQAMIHFTTITISHVLKELDIDINDSLEYASPIYRLRLNMVGRILNQSPDLYGNIEMMNQEVPGVLSTYMNTCQNLFDIIIKKDKNKFINYFNEAAAFLGDFKQSAQQESDSIINKMIKDDEE